MCALRKNLSALALSWQVIEHDDTSQSRPNFQRRREQECQLAQRSEQENKMRNAFVSELDVHCDVL